MLKNSMIKAGLVVSLLVLSIFISKESCAGGVWSCSSFVINGDGYIATAGHCVKGGTAFYVEYHGENYEAKLVATDYAHDVAIVKINAKTPDYFNLQLEGYESEEIYILGYPIPDIRGYDLKISKGHIEEIKDSEYLQAAGSCEGNSGGPVVNNQNQVIGVLVAGYGAPCAYYSESEKIEWIVLLALNNDIVVYFSDSSAKVSNILNTDESKVLFFIGEAN